MILAIKKKNSNKDHWSLLRSLEAVLKDLSNVATLNLRSEEERKRRNFPYTVLQAKDLLPPRLHRTGQKGLAASWFWKRPVELEGSQRQRLGTQLVEVTRPQVMGPFWLLCCLHLILMGPTFLNIQISKCQHSSSTNQVDYCHQFNVFLKKKNNFCYYFSFPKWGNQGFESALTKVL